MAPRPPLSACLPVCIEVRLKCRQLACSERVTERIAAATSAGTFEPSVFDHLTEDAGNVLALAVDGVGDLGRARCVVLADIVEHVVLSLLCLGSAPGQAGGVCSGRGIPA